MQIKPATILLGIISMAFLSSCDPYYQGQYGENSKYGGSSYLSGFEQNQQGQNTITHNGSAAPKGYWDGDGVTGTPKIRLSIDDQRAYYFKGDTLVGVSPISTGTDGHSTPRGRFKISQKSPDHKSSLYGIIKNDQTGQIIVSDAKIGRDKPGPGETFIHAPMPHFMRFNNAIGMHAGYLPGYPASHGCVRMPAYMAKKFFENTPNGTVVIVE